MARQRVTGGTLNLTGIPRAPERARLVEEAPKVAAGTIKFDKDIPIPPKGSGKTGHEPSAYAHMQPGDSFLATRRQYIALAAYGRKYGWKLVQRKQPDGTFRVWRVK